MRKSPEDRKKVEYIISRENEYQLVKGDIYCFSLGVDYLDLRYDGCLKDDKTLEFRIGDLGLLAKLWGKITKKEPGEPQLVRLGEFYPIGSITTTGEKWGFTPSELIARNDEKDYIVKVKCTLPEIKR